MQNNRRDDSAKKTDDIYEALLHPGTLSQSRRGTTPLWTTLPALCPAITASRGQPIRHPERARLHNLLAGSVRQTRSRLSEKRCNQSKSRQPINAQTQYKSGFVK